MKKISKKKKKIRKFFIFIKIEFRKFRYEKKKKNRVCEKVY
jgi:hypothetical protein